MLHNGVDLEHYSQESKKNDYEIVFVGRLKRFNETRNVNFLLQGLASLGADYTLKIVGATKFEILDLNEEAKKLGIESRVKILERVNYSDVAKELSSASIGILTNSGKNKHSKSHTSPLKYFEYLAANLKVIAVNFPSHNLLPEQENIHYFEYKDMCSFKNTIFEASQSPFFNIDIEKYSLNNRVKQIIQFFNT